MKNLSKTFLFLAACLFLSACQNLSQTPMIETYTPHKLLNIEKGKRIVLVGGCFDVLHKGHFYFLEKAKAQGDTLVVALEPDARITVSKKRTPIHTQAERAYNLSFLRSVDVILMLPVLQSYADYRQLVQDIHPTIIAITADDPQRANKEKQAQSIGARVVAVTDRIGDFSSTSIIRPTSSQALSDHQP